MNIKPVPALFTAVLLSISALFAIDPSGMTVPLSGFKKEMLAQNLTVYDVISAGEGFSLSSTSTQKILSKKKSRRKTTITIITGTDADSVETRAPSPRDTADTRFLNLTSEEIQNAAGRFKKSSSIAGDIENFVYTHITDKSFGIPLIPADAVYMHRAGDCTEHAVLAIALLRANNIPARAVVGVIFEEEFLGVKNSFVFHMWAEAFVDGKWVIVDPTRPGAIRANRYIAMTFHNLRSEAPLDYLTTIASIREMKIRYIRGYKKAADPE